ncbi:MAG TPA: ABC transporter substrate-binding protein [Afifellaceae bacterium]|nr:ABC transporter substrate-binding protein [Afifellaceae bacterium]
MKPNVLKGALFAAAIAVSGQAYAETILRYATISEPPSLDVQVGTATIASTISMHMFETLYAFDAGFEPQPLLASEDRIEDDGKTLVISIRKGVPFHNGKELTAKDVAASLKRWGEHGSRGKLLLGEGSSVEATGDYEVTIKLPAANGAWRNLLAFPNGGPVIYPEEIISKAGAEPIAKEDYIGTGPYKFTDWRPNRYVELSKFEDYAPAPGPASGLAGERVAMLDKIQFAPVPDVGTRVSGVQAGDYDYAEFVPGDLYDDLSSDPSVKIHVNGAPIFGLLFVNSKEGLLKDNFKLRRAVQMALNKEEALRVSIGPELLWDANGSFYPEGNAWYSDSGIKAYSQADPEGAKALAKEAGYDGEPIKLLVSTNYQFHYDQAAVFTKQLAEAGINVQMVVVDWATLLKKRAEPDQWDIFVTHHGTVPDPALITVLNDTYPGWWTTDTKQAAKAEFTGTADVAKRAEAWAKLQGLIYEEVPAMKTGDIYSYNIASPKLKGLPEKTVLWPNFWGVSK